MMKMQVVELSPDVFHAQARSLGIRLSENQSELFSTVTASDVSGADAGLQNRRKLLQQHIARLVAESVIENLKMI
jgi:hypothetical protein